MYRVIGDEVRMPSRGTAKTCVTKPKGGTLHAAEGYSKPPMQLGPIIL